MPWSLYWSRKSEGKHLLQRKYSRVTKGRSHVITFSEKLRTNSRFLQISNFSVRLLIDLISKHELIIHITSTIIHLLKNDSVFQPQKKTKGIDIY